MDKLYVADRLRILKLIYKVDNEIARYHTDIRVLYSRYEKAFTVKFYHKLLGLPTLEDILRRKYGDYSKFKLLYLVSNKRGFNVLAERHNVLYEMKTGLHHRNIFRIRQEHVLRDLRWELLDCKLPVIYLSEEQQRYVEYLEERLE